MDRYLIILLFPIIVIHISCKQDRTIKSSTPYVANKESQEISNLKPYYLKDKVYIESQVSLADSIFYQHPDSAYHILIGVIKNAVSTDHTKAIVSAYYLLSKYFTDRGRHGKSILLLQKGLDKAYHLHSQKSWMLYYYSALAFNYHQTFNYDSGSYYLYHGLTYIADNKDISPAAICFFYLQLSKIWRDNGNGIKSIEYLNRAHNIAIQIKDTTLLQEVLLQKSAIHLQNGYPDSAIVDATHALEYNPQSLKLKWSANYTIGSALVAKNKNKEALPYLEESLAIGQQTKNRLHLYFAKSGLAAAYSNIGAYQKAMPLFEQLLVSESQSNYRLNEILISLYQNMAITHGKLRNYDKALAYYETSARLRDSFYKIENVRTLATMETQHQVVEKDKEIAAHKIRLANQKSWVIGISGAAIVLVVLSLALLKRKKHKEQFAQLKAKFAGAEEERIRMAKELHDGVLSQLSAVKLKFATLSGIHIPAEAQGGGFREALKQLELSISELRITSHNLYPEILEQQGLVSALELFCEKISNIVPIKISFQSVGAVSSTLPCSFELSVYRMVQELVQNIVKHSDATNALVQLTATEQWLAISVEDDGHGLPVDWQKTGRGMGLSQLNNRLKAMQGSMEIENNNGTNIYIEFDLSKVHDEKNAN